MISRRIRTTEYIFLYFSFSKNSKKAIPIEDTWKYEFFPWKRDNNYFAQWIVTNERKEKRRSSSTISTELLKILFDSSLPFSFLRHLLLKEPDKSHVTPSSHHFRERCILPSRIFLVNAIKETKMAKKSCNGNQSRPFLFHRRREQENETSC